MPSAHQFVEVSTRRWTMKRRMNGMEQDGKSNARVQGNSIDFSHPNEHKGQVMHWMSVVACAWSAQNTDKNTVGRMGVECVARDMADAVSVYCMSWRRENIRRTKPKHSARNQSSLWVWIRTINSIFQCCDWCHQIDWTGKRKSCSIQKHWKLFSKHFASSRIHESVAHVPIEVKFNWTNVAFLLCCGSLSAWALSGGKRAFCDWTRERVGCRV